MDRGEPIHILIAERDEDNRAGALRMLTQAKLHNRLDIVPDGQALLDMLHDEETAPEVDLPDIILLDLHTPKKDGCTVLSELRADPLLKDIPVVLLTGGAADERMMHTADLEGKPTIPRPLTFDKLVHALATDPRFWLQIETNASD